MITKQIISKVLMALLLVSLVSANSLESSTMVGTSSINPVGTTKVIELSTQKFTFIEKDSSESITTSNKEILLGIKPKEETIVQPTTNYPTSGIKEYNSPEIKETTYTEKPKKSLVDGINSLPNIITADFKPTTFPLEFPRIAPKSDIVITPSENIFTEPTVTENIIQPKKTDLSGDDWFKLRPQEEIIVEQPKQENVIDLESQPIMCSGLSRRQINLGEKIIINGNIISTVVKVTPEGAILRVDGKLRQMVKIE